MARLGGRLTQKQVEHAKPKNGRPAIMIADGGNLYLQCTLGADDHVRRSWVFQYEQHGRRRAMGLGSLATISLKEARARARELRQQLLFRVDPLDDKRRAHMAALAERARLVTFKQAAEMYIRLHEAGWKHRKHRQQWQNTLATYAYPSIGNMSVADVDTVSVLKIVEPLWTSKTETAARVRARIESILDYASASGLRSGDNPARHVVQSLPKQARVRKVKHHAALPYADVPGFLAELRERDSISARALEWTVLTAARTSEVIGATWDEIDLKERAWTVPGSRMKTGKTHKVPLSARAVELLKALPRNGRYVFSGPNGRALSDAIMVRLAKLLRPGVTVHGFRSAFRDWCAEATNFPSVVAEMALAHAVGSAVERSYRRGDLFEKRGKLMAAWSEYCAKPAPTGATITPIRRSADHA